MKRSQILSILAFLGISSCAVFGFWCVGLWTTSRPLTAMAEVRGASTESLTASQGAGKLQPYPIQNSSIRKPVINARSYALYHKESGKLLLSKDGDKPVAIASTTKLMTAHIVAAQVEDLDETVTVPQEAAEVIGSQMNLYTDETITVRNLLYGLMLVSGNDAAHALADHLGGKLLNDTSAGHDEKVERFVEEMNAEAARLHMEQTSYKDPAGLNDEGRSSALDLAKLLSVVGDQALLRDITTTAQTTIYDVDGKIRHELRNSNRLVADYFYDGVGAGKTGFTPGAGHCLAGSATRNGSTLIAVILSTYSNDNDASALENRKLLNWGFESYSFE